MAMGPALTLLGVLALQPDRCQFIVRGERVPPSVLLQAVNFYRNAKQDEAIGLRRSLARREVEALLDRLREVPLEDRCLHAASLLETELALNFAERSQWEDADFELDAAWRLSTWIVSPDLKNRYQRDWLFAAGLFFHELVFLSVPAEAFWRADRFFDNAVKRYPEDPEILLAAGALLEWSGSLRHGIDSHLEEAEALYSRALELAPDDPEALLRHGLVLRKLGRNDEAAPPLLRALESGAGDDLIYRSRMGLGGLAEGAGNLPEAIENYEAASKLIPSWQVARLALSHALHSSGDHERARTVLDEALAMKDSEEALLGWWSYELGLAPRFESLFQRMRAEGTR